MLDQSYETKLNAELQKNMDNSFDSASTSGALPTPYIGAALKCVVRGWLSFFILVLVRAEYIDYLWSGSEQRMRCRST